MMAGKRRLSTSESAPDSNDSTFQSKRIFEGSSFDVHRAQQSQFQSVSTPPLDNHRAELSRQHVKALNTQFASWVQSQLQNHPDELWEDGVQDYLDHAKHIKEKFSDIVTWLKTNASKGESLFGLNSQGAPKKSLFELKDNPVQLSTDQHSFGIKEQNIFGNKDNVLKGESVFGFASQDAPEKSCENKDNPVKEQSSFDSKEQNPFGIIKEPFSFGAKEQPIFGVFSTTPSSSWSSGFTTQSPFSSGNQVAAPSTNDAPNDGDGEEEPQQPSSPSVKKTEEKGIIVVHEVKCKLYVKSSGPADTSSWKDKGTGQLSIKCREGFSKGSKESKPVILVRNDVGRISLNASLYSGIKTNLQKNSIVVIFHTASESGNDGGENNSVVARTFLIKTKTEEDRNKLASAIQEYAPAT